MMPSAMPGSFRFGEFELDAAAFALRRSGRGLKLEKMPMEVLVLLVRRAGRLVTRSDIKAAVWGADVFVDQDAAINTAIRKIRRALEDDAEHPRFIETVIGKGYRFIARDDVEPERRVSRYLVTRGKRQFVLGAGENLLGRDPDAAVFIDHPSVSRRHARISIEPARAVLEDLESRNGTFLDGRPLDAPAELHHGAIIGLGPITLTFIVLPPVASTLPMSPGTARTPRA